MMKMLGKNIPVLFLPASRQDSDPRIPSKRVPFQEMENFRQGEPSIFPNMEEFNLMKQPSSRG